MTAPFFRNSCRTAPTTASDDCDVFDKKPKQKKCAICKDMFSLFRSMQKVCGKLECARSAGEAKTLKDRAKREQEERAKTRVQKEALKTRSQWLKEAQAAFNSFIRERDSSQPCICCNRTKVDNHLTGSSWDAGHYRSTGSAPHMRFIENNVHRQLVYCNQYKAGNAVDYRIGLIKRIGLEAVAALESDNTVRKYTIDDLKAIKATYRAKFKQLLANKEVA